MKIVGKCQELIRNSENCRNFRKLQIFVQILVNLLKFVENVEELWKIMENVEKLWKIMKNVWKMQTNYDKLWKMYGKLLLRYTVHKYVFISYSNYVYCTKILCIIENFMSLRASHLLFYLVLLNCECYEMYMM